MGHRTCLRGPNGTKSCTRARTIISSGTCSRRARKRTKMPQSFQPPAKIRWLSSKSPMRTQNRKRRVRTVMWARSGGWGPSLKKWTASSLRTRIRRRRTPCRKSSILSLLHSSIRASACFAVRRSVVSEWFSNTIASAVEKPFATIAASSRGDCAKLTRRSTECAMNVMHWWQTICWRGCLSAKRSRRSRIMSSSARNLRRQMWCESRPGRT